MFLSGTITPCEAMPAGVRELTYLFPMRWYVEITYAIFFKGAGPDKLLFQIFMLFFLGIAMFFAGSVRFRKSLELSK